ncbi:hypothetical protein AXF42_Ash004990 [Apostasia shenzhenica]|uniref:Uncharacterized protein n=1 Tax=Apostasia shenzhenica TaxID=1088818 RepID=A0A2I0B844_9ASPA|nr:hypothetical protein AXF42_Ash004990 [Apostasia shenzhenica]
MLSGWSTKEKLACPNCNKNTHSLRLSHECKQCYMGHLRFLPKKHRWMYDAASFDGTKEQRLAPKFLTRSEILSQVIDLEGKLLSKNTKVKEKVSHEKRGDN